MTADEGWVQQFRTSVSDLPEILGAGASYQVASGRLRQLVRSGLLKHTAVRDTPERFFAAHRVLSEYATKLGPGFGIRFTVQFNLFAGTLAAIGTEGKPPLLQRIRAGIIGWQANSGCCLFAGRCCH